MYNPHDNHYFIEYILKEMRRESNLSLQKNQPQKRQVVEVRDKIIKRHTKYCCNDTSKLLFISKHSNVSGLNCPIKRQIFK